MQSPSLNERLTEGVSYAGSGVAILSGLTLSEWGIIIGIATAVLTLALNAFFAWRKDRREEKALKAAMCGECERRGHLPPPDKGASDVG